MAGSKRFKTPLQAIRAKCLDCSGGDTAEVEGCLIPDCPLYTFRTGLELRCDVIPAQKKAFADIPEASGPGTGSREAGRTTKVKQASAYSTCCSRQLYLTVEAGNIGFAD
ncbi:MAG: hypothetical protein LBC55_09545 [Desulfovibrio sp.]|jgi:hypothetical protein|nr:hypothetical protein [Desulfovibrio sp.]